MRRTVSVQTFRRAIQALPSDEPNDDPSVWYRTEKEHWLGWLGVYDGPGGYGRLTGKRRDARFAYNHLVNPYMLLWLVEAARVKPSLVVAARRCCRRRAALGTRSAAIRRLVPWEVLQAALWRSRSMPAETAAGRRTSHPPSLRDRITTTIEREPLKEIIARRKRIEYRALKPYWTLRFSRVCVPFELRLINGMKPGAPEVTVLISKVTKSARDKEYRLHIARVLEVKQWDRRAERPARTDR